MVGQSGDAAIAAETVSIDEIGEIPIATEQLVQFPDRDADAPFVASTISSNANLANAARLNTNVLGQEVIASPNFSRDFFDGIEAAQNQRDAPFTSIDEALNFISHPDAPLSLREGANPDVALQLINEASRPRSITEAPLQRDQVFADAVRAGITVADGVPNIFVPAEGGRIPFEAFERTVRGPRNFARIPGTNDIADVELENFLREEQNNLKLGATNTPPRS